MFFTFDNVYALYFKWSTALHRNMYSTEAANSMSTFPKRFSESKHVIFRQIQNALFIYRAESCPFSIDNTQ